VRLPLSGKLIGCTLFGLGSWLGALGAGSWSIDSVLARGDSCIAVAWTVAQRNIVHPWYTQCIKSCTSGSDTAYRHCDFLPGVTYYSIAYSYGGEDPWRVFKTKVDTGCAVGSHLCQYSLCGDPTPKVAGTDCSGFLCYIWNVPRVSTGNLLLDTSYKKIPRSQLRQGDALVKGGSHAIFVVETDSTGQALLWESTSVTNSCRERVADLNSADLVAYTPLRNPGLLLDPSPVSQPRFKPVVNHIRRTFPGTTRYNCAGRAINQGQLGVHSGIMIEEKSLSMLPHHPLSRDVRH
jgi:hypothetical protein